MRIKNYEIVLSASRRVWYRYFLPRRLTLKTSRPIYRWLFWSWSRAKQTPAYSPILRDFIAHLDACPFGWYEDRVITARSTTETDILAWLQKLDELKDCARSIVDGD